MTDSAILAKSSSFAIWGKFSIDRGVLGGRVIVYFRDTDVEKILSHTAGTIISVGQANLSHNKKRICYGWKATK